MDSRSKLDEPSASVALTTREIPPGSVGTLRVAVLVDEVAELEAAAGDPSALVDSTSSIVAALENLGHLPVMLEMQPGKPGDWLRRLITERFDLAFNLCETVAGKSAGEHLAAASVELLGLPMTGARSTTLLYCLNKDACNATLRANGIPVPDWRLIHAAQGAPAGWSVYPAIVKPAAEDGSNGVHSGSVVDDGEELAAAIERLGKTFKRLLVQEFVNGREINLALVGHHLLPPAEIDFGQLPDDCPPIVSYEAKWLDGSPEDLGTRPICPARLGEAEAAELQQLAARAWGLMEGRGYARVDVRLRANGEPAVIDINPNPDLGPDAGLARQARVAGWSYEELIGRIVEGALDPRVGAPVPPSEYVRLEARCPEGEPV